MNKEQIYRWQGQMFIYSCWLYDNEFETVFSDSEFDEFCVLLLSCYDDLPFDIQDRIPKGNLEAGTSLGLTYNTDDGIHAVQWFERVRGRSPTLNF